MKLASVLHLGAGRYDESHLDHPTFHIWRALARGVEQYTVVGRSTSRRRIVLSDGPLTVHLLPSRFASEAEFLVTQMGAIPIARRVRPQVVISQSPTLGGVAAVRIGSELGSGVLLEIHGDHYFAVAPRFSRNGVIQAVAARTLPRATRIRVLSQTMARRLVAHYGTRLEPRIAVLPPRVDLRRFMCPKQSWAIEGRPPRVIMVGTINERKGQLRFLRAVLGRLDLEVWLAGEGPDAADCVSLAQELGAADRLRMLGHVGHDQLPLVLAGADVMVMYSNSEGTPRALMEAMAMALPVITTDAGFCRDVVENGVEGIVLGARPDAEVVQALQSVLVDEALRCRLGKNGRRRAESEYDSEMIYDRYRALIRETASR